MKKYRIYLIGAAILILGIIIGNTFSGSDKATTDTHKKEEHNFVQDPVTKLWTCSMHPQIKMKKPGKCPICGMTLIPVSNNKSEEKVGDDEVVLTADAIKLADIQSSKVMKASAIKDLRLLGRIQPDERKLYNQAAHIPGRIERLYVNFTGEKVVKGQKIISLYSPELITAQKELFEAIKSKKIYPQLYTATINKLKLWKLTDAQISAIEKSGKVQENIDILSDYTGYVMKRKVELGDHVMAGTNLFKIADLSRVWIMFEAYERDLPFIHLNDAVSFTVQALKGQAFKGKVTYIDPFVDAKTRIAKVRVEVGNKNAKLLPEMYVNGLIKARLKNSSDVIVVPKSAVLWTGKRSVVYVKMPHKTITSFKYREVILGETLGDFYIIKNGLKAGEVIATNAVFRIDAAAQLNGQKSMMNPTGAKGNTGGMNMPGMDMGGDKKKSKMSDAEMKKMKKPAKNRGNMVMIDKNKIDKKFKRQLGQVVHVYIQLKDALAKDDFVTAKNNSKALKSAFAKVDMSLLLGDAHNAWMADLKMLNRANNSIIAAKNIKNQRNNFGPLGAALSKVIDTYGIISKKDKIYLDYCPMVKQVWLSYDKAIINPYYGKSMPTCGEVKKEIVSNK
ncbi:MAG: efflux RND transporter periplasmic adaptor subunit [Flavobacteriaceae bacterium]|nr:efflux RND transporter periplasmic adaptor subunit [Flavobacteriaceae bacterium]